MPVPDYQLFSDIATHQKMFAESLNAKPDGDLADALHD
jgi:hypothetical protein